MRKIEQFASLLDLTSLEITPEAFQANARFISMARLMLPLLAESVVYLQDMCAQADEDTPAEARSSHFTETLVGATDFLEELNKPNLMTKLEVLGEKLKARGYDLDELDKDNPFNPNPQIFDTYADKMEAQAEEPTKPTLTDVFDVDFGLLRQSKFELIKALDNESYDEHSLAALLVVIDHFQDCAVKSGCVAKAVVFPCETHTVRLYAYATVAVPNAMSAEDAAVIAINAEYSWNLATDSYDTSWSLNEVMDVDVFINGDEAGYFSQLSLCDKAPLPKKFELGKSYEVGMYFNIEIEVTDATSEAEAITTAEEANITGEIISVSGELAVTWQFSSAMAATAESNLRLAA